MHGELSPKSRLARYALLVVGLVPFAESVLFTGASVTTPLPSSAHGTGPVCLRYEPDTVAIAGILTRKTFPGRPSYESVKEGDEPETGFYLEVPIPVCTIASPDSASDNNGSLHDIRLVQLVLDSAGYARLKPRLGRQVTLRGTLFAAFTGHHHAPMLLRVVGRP
jgi:hypothetical protein